MARPSPCAGRGAANQQRADAPRGQEPPAGATGAAAGAAAGAAGAVVGGEWAHRSDGPWPIHASTA
eukprot:3088166-Prymnesium_polylepis.1